MENGLPDKIIVNAVLADINKLRRKVGLPTIRSLLRGELGSYCFCPIARTAGIGTFHGAGAGRTTLFIYDRGTTYMRVLSETTRRFIQDFDRGFYPGLVR